MTVAAPATTVASENATAPGSATIPAERDAVLILAVSRGMGTTYVFRPVDLAARSFTALPDVQLQSSILGFGDEMKGGDLADDDSSGTTSLGRGIQLLMASVPAGDYAVVEVYYGNIDGCINESSVVVRVPAHKITMVSSADVAPPEVFSRLPTNTDRSRILQAFNVARVNYPNLEGTPVNAEIVARIRWHSDSDFFFGNRCRTSEQFSTIQPVTADTSVARAAALEEAQKNLAKAKSGTTEQSVPPAATGNKQ
jgi:hypothetical protein